MNETQRAAAIRLSSLTPGGDGTTLTLDLNIGSLLDFMNNPSPFQTNQAPGSMVLIEYPDLTQPKIRSASLNYGTGLLILDANEFLDGTTLTPLTCVNGSAFVVLSSNSSLGFIPTRLVGSAISLTERKDGTTIVLQLLESVRLVIQQQQDLLLGSQLTLAASQGAVFDLMRNPNVENLTLALPTIPDTVPPVVTQVELDYGTGRITITTDESCNIGIVTGEGLFQYKLRLSNQTVNTSYGFDHELNTPLIEIIELKDATFSGKQPAKVSSVQFVITLSEENRIKALRMSGTVGGDTRPLFFSVEPNAFSDMVGNNNTAQVLIIDESPDTVLPILISAALDYSTGRLTIVSNEILDLTSLRFGSLLSSFNVENFFNTSTLLLTDVQGDLNTIVARLQSATASYVHTDGYVVSIDILESHRAKGVAASNAIDGEGVYLSCRSGFVRDYAGNLNANDPSIAVVESIDVVSPTVIGASLNLGTGIFTLQASETMALKVTSGARFNLTLFSLFNYGATEPFLLQTTNNTIESARLFFTQEYAFGGTESDSFPYFETDGTEIYNWTTGNHLQNTLDNDFPYVDATSVQFQVPEPFRIAALRMSGTPGGDGLALSFRSEANAFVDLMGNPSIGTSGAPPVMYNGRAVSSGVLSGSSFTAHDFTADNQNLIVVVDGGSPQTISVVTNCDTLVNCATALSASITGASVTVNVATSTLMITSSTTGVASTVSITATGSGLNALYTFCSNPLLVNALVVNGAAASSGTLTGTSFEAHDFTSDNQNLIVVVDGGSPQTVSVVSNCDTTTNCATALSALITGATVSAISNNLVVTSSTTGTTSTVSVIETGSGNNVMSLFGYGGSHIVVVEISDTVRPQVAPTSGGGLNGAPGLNYNTGEFAVKFNEIVDGTPTSLIHLDRIVVTDRFNENNVSLSGSEFVYTRDRETIYFIVATNPLQRIITIADDAEAVEQAIDIPVKVHFYTGAAVDLAGNPSVLVEELRLQDRNNSRGVPKIKSMSFATIETGFKREMKFFGSKRLPGDAAKFVGFNDTDCFGATVGGVATPDAPDITDSDGVITLPYGGVNVTFAETSPVGYPYKICYYFLADTEGNGFQIVPEVFLTVVQLDSVDVSSGTNNQTVVGQEKFYTFGGVGVAAGDSAKWVPGGGHPTDACDIQTATTVNGNTASDNVVTVTSPGDSYVKGISDGNFLSFGEYSPTNGLPYVLCYAFTSRNLPNALPEPYKMHPEFTLTVSELLGVGATAGDNFSTVVHQSKNFAFVGAGVGDGDKVRFISGSNHSAIDLNCLTDPRAGGMVGASVTDNELTVTGPSGNFANEVTFMLRSNPTEPFRLCYKFGDEPYRLYPIFTIESRHVLRVQTIVGAPNVAVVNAPKTYYFVGTGQQNAVDVVKIVGATVTDDAGCATYNIPVTTDGGSGGPITSAITSSSVGVDGNLEVSASITLTFLTESPFDPWRLCYKFHNEPFKLYSGLTFSARRVAYITASSGSSTLFVANHRVGKEWSVYGYGLREGDKLKWVPNTVTSDLECGVGSANAQAIAGTGVVSNQLVVRTFATLGLVNSVPVELIISSATSHGGPLVLCYQFEDEPYKLYSDIQVNVAVLTNLTVNVGSVTQIVVGASKTITLSGVGLNTGDQFKYVPGDTKTDAGCGQGSTNAHDGFIGTYTASAGTVITFQTSSDSGALKLCYKFGTEVYKLYTGFTLSVASVERIDSNVGDSGVAVVGVSKVLTFIGTAISQNSNAPDMFKYIRLPSGVTPTSSPEILTLACDQQQSFTQVTGGETVAITGDATVVFNEMSPAGSPYVLCYRFGIEPYRALMEFSMVAKQLEGVLKGQPVTTIVSALQNVTFLGTHVSDYVFGLGGKGAGVADQAKWVESYAGNPSASTSVYCQHAPPSHGSQESLVDRRPCSSTYECNLTPRGIGTFAFNSSTQRQTSEGTYDTSPLQLCYRFGTEAWQLIDLSVASLQVYNGEILDSSTHTAVVGREKFIAFAGTTGIATGGDAAKWVLFGSINCDAPGQNVETVSTNTLAASPSTLLAPAPLGSYYGVPTASSFLFSTIPPSGQPYILCYRFGGAMDHSGKATPFVLFPLVRLHVKALEAAVMPSGETTELTAGNKITFRFDGRGVADGDQVLWFRKRDVVAGSVMNDGTCDLMVLTAEKNGLKNVVRDAHASFSFPIPNPDIPSEADEYILCYKFDTEEYKLYNELPLVDETEAAALASIATFKNTRVVIKISLTTLRNDPTTDLDYYPPNTVARSVFIDTFRGDMSRALGVQKERIRVLSLSRGSIVVEFVIDPVRVEDSGGLLAQQAASLLERQVLESDPLLLTGETTQNVDTSPAAQPNPSVTVETVTTTTTAAGSTASPSSSSDTRTTTDPATGTTTTTEQNTQDSGTQESVVLNINGTNITYSTALGRAGAQPSFTTLAVVQTQKSGLFAFEHREYNVMEDIGAATVKVVRLGGTVGSVTIKYETVNAPDAYAGTASSMLDYTPVSGLIVFHEGESMKTFSVPIARDNVLENHFETIKLRINPLQNGIAGQALSAAASRYSECQIKIFDAYNPNVIANPLATASSADDDSTVASVAVDTRALVADSFGLDSGSTNSTMGWRIVGNGDNSLPHMQEALTGMKEIDSVGGTAALVAAQVSQGGIHTLDYPLWVDTNGLYSVDRIYGSSEYNASCDYAAPLSPCDHSCEYGGGYAANGGNGSGYGTGVLRLSMHNNTNNAADRPYVATTSPVTDFPKTQFTVAMWIRTSDLEQEGNEGTLISYEVPASAMDGVNKGYGAHELLVYNASSITLIIRGTLDTYNSNKRQMGLSTNVNVADGTWHHLAITWNSAGGEVFVYRDGIVVFDGGPYQTELTLRSGGSFVIGRTQYLNTPCYNGGVANSNSNSNALGGGASSADTNAGASSESGALSAAGTLNAQNNLNSNEFCLFDDLNGGLLLADLQNVRVWNTVRSQHHIHLGMRWPFTALRLGLILYWHFDPTTLIHNSNNNVHSLIVPDLGEDGLNHPGVLSATGATSVVPGSASMNPNYPCGDVYSNVWHFVAPQRFLSQLRHGYDGRLQFSMLASSHSGTERPARGSVELQTSNGKRFSYALNRFEPLSSGKWMSYSVILREDFGWIHEPSGEPATFDQFFDALKQPSALMIRGDQWTYSREGYGQEAVYINNITLMSARELS